MKKVLLFVGLLVVVSMLPGCMMFAHSTDRSDSYDGNSGHSGHSHH